MNRRSAPEWPRIALLTWLSVLAAVVGHALVYPRAHSLFDVYALASRRWWAGLDVYLRGREYYRYSPLFAVTMTPLAYLPERLGAALWKLLNGAAYGFALSMWSRWALPGSRNRGEVARLCLLGLPLALHSMHNGQANLVMLAAALMAVTDAAGRRWNRAAGWLAAAVLIKGYPMALALLLVALYPRQLALRFSLALVLGLVLPFATQPVELVAGQYASWWHHLRDSEHIMRERIRSLNYLWAVAGLPRTLRTWDALEAVAGAVALCLCLLQSRRLRDERSRLCWALSWFLLWAVLFGPATESCTYVLAAPVVAWALVEAFRTNAPLAVRGVLVASLLLMGVLSTDFFPRALREFVNQYGGQPIGALLLLGYLLSQVRKPWPGAAYAAIADSPGCPPRAATQSAA